MQAFGKTSELQKAKIAEVTARSCLLGGLVARALDPDPFSRASAAQLVQEIEALEDSRWTNNSSAAPVVDESGILGGMYMCKSITAPDLADLAFMYLSTTPTTCIHSQPGQAE